MKSMVLDWFKKKLNRKQEAIEEEFRKGNIILPTGKTDYANFSEFKEKTYNLEGIREGIIKIEEDDGKQVR